MLARALPVPDRSFFLFGPRGTGKTSWIEANFPKARIYDLLRQSEHLRLQRDPGTFAAECEALPEDSWVVIDEVQKAPLLLDEVQRLMKRKLRFVLSGSSARKLRRGGANLLAGRAITRHMFPFVSHELGFRRSLDDCLAHGMLPMAVQSDKPGQFLRSYVETYLAEEIQSEALVRQIGAFARFLEIAGRLNGQSVNVAGLARDAQVARQTVEDWLQILEDTLIAFWLPPWKEKRGVKQVAHSKLYLFDCGVARHMAGLGHLAVHPEERGFLLESYLLHEIRAFLHVRELDYPVFSWRTHYDAEVDLLVEARDTLWVIEMKSSSRWDTRFTRGLLAFRDDLGRRKVEALGIFTGPRALADRGVRVLPWREFLQRLWGGELIQ